MSLSDLLYNVPDARFLPYHKVMGKSASFPMLIQLYTTRMCLTRVSTRKSTFLFKNLKLSFGSSIGKSVCKKHKSKREFSAFQQLKFPGSRHQLEKLTWFLRNWINWDLIALRTDYTATIGKWSLIALLCFTPHGHSEPANWVRNCPCCSFIEPFWTNGVRFPRSPRSSAFTIPAYHR